ncbi:hypothetical protein ACH5RR_031152 [Cinchona calisaya]|uniref:Late embryogenesis abundant protein LEA-2 subgroup domain-containing protein n=1 Tax=Cinchona calisaya TaxID=153742 RepID=A0ABD2YHV3_9GENT
MDANGDIRHGRRNVYRARPLFTMPLTMVFILLSSVAITRFVESYFGFGKPAITPCFCIESLSILPLPLSPNNSNFSPFKTGWNITFQVENPYGDFYALSYDDMVAKVYFGEKPIWEAAIPSFEQTHQDFLEVNFPAMSVTVEDIESEFCWDFSVRLRANVAQKRRNQGRREYNWGGRMLDVWFGLDAEFSRTLGVLEGVKGTGRCEVSVVKPKLEARVVFGIKFCLMLIVLKISNAIRL